MGNGRYCSRPHKVCKPATRVFLRPPGWDASPSQGSPSFRFASTHFYTWVERGTGQGSKTQTVRSGDECTNHEATTPPETSRPHCGVLNHGLSGLGLGVARVIAGYMHF